MAVGDAYVFPGFLSPQLFYPKPPTTFLTCFCSGERLKYAGKKSHLNQGSNSQPPGHESDMLTTEPPGRGYKGSKRWLGETMYEISVNSLHTIPTFNDRKEEGFGKHCGIRKKCWQPAFSSFPTVFSTLSQREFVILARLNLSPSNAFNFVMSKNLSFGKGLLGIFGTHWKDNINKMMLKSALHTIQSIM